MYSMFPLLQAAKQSSGGASMSLIFILLIILVFYFFMIRPQQKKQKQVEEFRKGLQKGARITTIGGIHGKIVNIKDNTFIVEIANDVVIEIEQAAVSIDEAQLKAAAKAKKEENK